jgi:hypothetical protein
MIEPLHRLEIMPSDRILIRMAVKAKETASLNYFFDFYLKLVEFRISDGLPVLHDLLKHAGLLDHALSDAELACLGQVKAFSTAPDGNSPALHEFWKNCEHPIDTPLNNPPPFPKAIR